MGTRLKVLTISAILSTPSLFHMFGHDIQVLVGGFVTCVKRCSIITFLAGSAQYICCSNNALEVYTKLSMAADGNYTCFRHSVRERNILVLSNASCGLDKDNTSHFIPQSAKNLT